MTKEDFQTQMDRIVRSFDDRNYNSERIQIIYGHVKDLTKSEFKSICDDFLTRLPFNQSPLGSHFKEAAIAKRKQRFNEEVVKASTALKQKGGLEETLQKLGAKSLMDAIFKSRFD